MGYTYITLHGLPPSAAPSVMDMARCVTCISVSKSQRGGIVNQLYGNATTFQRGVSQAMTGEALALWMLVDFRRARQREWTTRICQRSREVQSGVGLGRRRANANNPAYPASSLLRSAFALELFWGQHVLRRYADDTRRQAGFAPSSVRADKIPAISLAPRNTARSRIVWGNAQKQDDRGTGEEGESHRSGREWMMKSVRGDATVHGQRHDSNGLPPRFCLIDWGVQHVFTVVTQEMMRHLDSNRMMRVLSDHNVGLVDVGEFAPNMMVAINILHSDHFAKGAQEREGGGDQSSHEREKMYWPLVKEMHMIQDDSIRFSSLPINLC
nr:hypothetical protein CFP56_43886 [Quercus suber]